MCGREGQEEQGENYHCLNTPCEKHCAMYAATFHGLTSKLGNAGSGVSIFS